MHLFIEIGQLMNKGSSIEVVNMSNVLTQCFWAAINRIKDSPITGTTFLLAPEYIQ